MRVVVNGQERECSAATLFDLWREEAEAMEVTEPRGFAVALNGAVVHRSEWQGTGLSAGDQVEIIRAFAGG
jgi:sulfur carrier protein